MRTITTLAILLFAVPTLHAELVAPNNSQRLENYRTSWIGNSYGGLNPETGKGQWVQQDIAALCVTPDGTVYTNVPWEEGGGNCMMYKDGEMLSHSRYTHGWGFNGGKAVAVNDKYVFIALMGNNEGGGLDDADTWPPKGFDWYGISRRLRSDFTQGAPFEHGKGGKGDTLPKSFLVINEVSNEQGRNAIDGPGAIAGLWADNERLYVSNPLENRIEIYDTETMRKIEEWDLKQYGFSEPGQIAADQKGNIWVYHLETIEDEFPHPLKNSPTITQFDRSGKKLKGRITVAYHHSAIGPFCFGPDNTMYVSDGYIGILSLSWHEEDGCFIMPRAEAIGKVTDKRAVKLLCSTDAMLSEGWILTYNPWKFGDLCFTSTSVKAIGCDAAGNLYIAQDLSTNGGGAVLESYQLTGKEKKIPIPTELVDDYYAQLIEAKINWRLFGLCFIDCASLDPEDETIAYTKDKKFKLDWSQTEPGKEWSFIGTTTFDRSSGRLDSRLDVKDSAGIWVRSLWEDRIFFVNDMNSQWMQIFLSQNMEVEDTEVGTGANFYAFFAGKKPNFSRVTYNTNDYNNQRREDGEFILVGNRFFTNQRDKNEPAAQGWWVDSDLSVWRASEREGIRRFDSGTIKTTEIKEAFQEAMEEHGEVLLREKIKEAFQELAEEYGEELLTILKIIEDDDLEKLFATLVALQTGAGLSWDFENMDTFPHPQEFNQVKRIRYYPETDTLYLGGCAAVDGKEHKNQHWKPMGPVLARYDNFLKGENPGTTEGKLKWRVVLPYVVGSSGHESCEPMGFDVAGDYIFVPYTGASRVSGFKTGHVEVLRTDDASAVGWMEPCPQMVGEIGLQDIRECLSAHQLKSGEYVIFLEDDYKAKVVMYRWMP